MVLVLVCTKPRLIPKATTGGYDVLTTMPSYPNEENDRAADTNVCATNPSRPKEPFWLKRIGRRLN